MRTMDGSSITGWWLLLIGATVLSWQFGHGWDFGGDAHYGTAAVIVIAFLKVRVVFLEFMELRHAPLPLRLAFELWALVVGGTIIALYWPAG